MMTKEEYRVKMKELGWDDEAIESHVETIKKVEKLLGKKVPFEYHVYKCVQVVYDESKTFET